MYNQWKTMPNPNPSVWGLAGERQDCIWRRQVQFSVIWNLELYLKQIVHRKMVVSRLLWQAEYPLWCKSCDFLLSYGSVLRPLGVWWHHGRLSTHCGASHVISSYPMAVQCSRYGSGGTMAGWLFIAVQVVWFPTILWQAYYWLE